MKLTIELVPRMCWYSNVRTNVTREKWNVIRKECYRKANYKCEICGFKGEAHPVECHEIWEYDDVNYIQKLVGFIALCPNCHRVKHTGLAQVNNEIPLVVNQLCLVNEITHNEARLYINKSFSLWEKRSKHNWKLDISFIE